MSIVYHQTTGALRPDQEPLLRLGYASATEVVPLRISRPCASKRSRHGFVEMPQHQERVRQNVSLRMELRRLRNPAHRCDFGQNAGEEPGSSKKLKGWPRRTLAEHAPNLVPNALTAHAVDRAGEALNSGGRGRFQPETRAGGEANSSEQPKGVLTETLLGDTHRPNDAGRQIRSPVDVIDHTVLKRVIHEGIDCEITPSSIFFRRGEMDTLWAATVMVFPVASECCDFVFPLVAYHQDYAKSLADWHCSGEKGLDLVRHSVGDDVPVLGRNAQQMVADAAADEERIMTGLA